MKGRLIGQQGDLRRAIAIGRAEGEQLCGAGRLRLVHPQPMPESRSLAHGRKDARVPKTAFRRVIHAGPDFIRMDARGPQPAQQWPPAEPASFGQRLFEGVAYAVTAYRSEERRAGKEG